MSHAFDTRLREVLTSTVEHFGTPFYLYDADGIDRNCRAFNAAFSGLPVREFFAVKALPNPTVLRRLAEHGFGFDCSSLSELTLARRAGASGRDIVYTSNNTSVAELGVAVTSGALVNIDDEAFEGAGLQTGPLGQLIGPGGGLALLVSGSGLLLAMWAVRGWFHRRLRFVEDELPDALPGAEIPDRDTVQEEADARL